MLFDKVEIDGAATYNNKSENIEKIEIENVKEIKIKKQHICQKELLLLQRIYFYLYAETRSLVFSFLSVAVERTHYAHPISAVKCLSDQNSI